MFLLKILGGKALKIYQRAGFLLDIKPEEVMAIVRSSRLGAFMSILNALLIAICVWSEEKTVFIISWFTISSLLFLFIAHRSNIARGYQPLRVSKRAVRRLALFALLHALPWVVLTAACLGTGGMRDSLMILMVCAGMSFGGGFMLYRVPLAGLCYTGSILLTVITTVTINNFSELWPVIIYSGTYGLTLFNIIIVSWKIAREREQSLLNASKANKSLQQANGEIKRLAMQDKLTNLANRDAFSEALGERILSSQYSKFAVFLLDLDRFKNVNDSVGHFAGDKLLQIVTDHLQKAIKPGDILARFGGDEFALIIDLSQTRSTAVEIARDFLDRLNTPVLIERTLIYPNASIGISVYPEQADNTSELIRLADIALHRAKDAGRGRCEVYDNRMGASLARSDEIETAIRKAMVDRRITMYYQPKIDLQTEGYVGAEALIRWFDEEGKPANIMDLLEVSADRGLIPQISSFVFDHVTKDILNWKKDGLTATPISVNVHPHDLKTPQLLLTRLRNMLDQGLKHTDIILEVTEGCFVGRGSDEATVTLDTINEMGFKLSLDDFGTGHAALSHLKRLPVRELKVDREFINGICNDRRDQAITTAAFEISRCLEIDCVAEGVETKEQVEALKELHRNGGSLIGQGYLWAKPMPAEEFVEFVRRHRNTDRSLKVV